MDVPFGHCPACGTELPADGHVALCPHCSVILDEGVPGAMARNKVSREQAIKAIRNWWGGVTMAYDLNRRAQITDCDLRYVPFWKLRAKADGCILGYSQGIEYESKIAIKIDQAYVWTGIACDGREFGVEYLRSLDIETEPYDPHLKFVVSPTITMRDAMANGRSSIEYEALKGVNVPNIIFKRIDVVPSDAILVFYPLWAIRYSYSVQKYSATVDGVTGTVLAGRAPGDLRLRRIVLAAGIAIGILGAILSIWISIVVHMPAAIFLVFVMAAVCLIIVYGALEFYNSDPEITVGEFGGRFRHASGLDRFIFGDVEPVRKES